MEVVNVKKQNICKDDHDNWKWCKDKNNVYIGCKRTVFIDNDLL